MHEDIVQQGIPDHFAELISRLDDSANEESRLKRTTQQKEEYLSKFHHIDPD